MNKVKQMFEIKAKDNMGRVGVLKTKHGDVKTPASLPQIRTSDALGVCWSRTRLNWSGVSAFVR